jgi:hypothetical protein
MHGSVSPVIKINYATKPITCETGHRDAAIPDSLAARIMADYADYYQ